MRSGAVEAIAPPTFAARARALPARASVTVREHAGWLVLKGVTMEVTDTCKDWIGEKGYDMVFGARPLRRVIQDEIEDRLSDALLENRFQEGDRVLIDVEAGEVILKKAEQPALA